MFRTWEEAPPPVAPVGVPTIRGRPHRAALGSVRRVLVTTTHASHGAPLVPYGVREQFLSTIAGGLRLLQEGGVEVKLRVHPTQTVEPDERVARRLGVRLEFTGRQPIGEAATEYDVVVGAPSSVLYEAAALGLPVVAWDGGIPAEIRESRLIGPLSERHATLFSSSAEFEELARRMLTQPRIVLAEAEDFRVELASFACEFEVNTFADRLRRLGTAIGA